VGGDPLRGVTTHVEMRNRMVKRSGRETVLDPNIVDALIADRRDDDQDRPMQRLTPREREVSPRSLTARATARSPVPCRSQTWASNGT
jgi:hypothetical protein